MQLKIFYGSFVHHFSVFVVFMTTNVVEAQMNMIASVNEEDAANVFHISDNLSPALSPLVKETTGKNRGVLDKPDLLNNTSNLLGSLGRQLQDLKVVGSTPS